MTTIDGEDMCPNIKAHTFVVMEMAFYFSISQARTQILRGFDHNPFSYLSSIIVEKLSPLQLIIELVGLFIQLIGLS